MTAHTPTPWRIIGANTTDVAIRGPQGPDGFGELVAVMGEKQPTANARLIVTAVNTHQAMRDALLAWLEVMGCRDGDDRYGTSNVEREALQLTHAALATLSEVTP